MTASEMSSNAHCYQNKLKEKSVPTDGGVIKYNCLFSTAYNAREILNALKSPKWGQVVKQ